MENYKGITELLLKHIRQELTGEESEYLANWAAESTINAAFLDEISNTPELMAEVRDYSAAQQINLNEAWEKMKARGWDVPVTDQPSKIVRMSWWRYAAAAVIVLSVSIGVYMLQQSRKPSAPAIVQTTLKSDVTPKTSHAILTLDNGEKIILDSLQPGLLATQGNSQIVKQENGVLSYSAGDNRKGAKLIYNTVTVPKGSDVVYLQLSDRSKVWLNAASSIRYPVAFNDSVRQVEITGEAYFEVTSVSSGGAYDKSSAPNGKQTFIVSKGNMSVVVLGTKFNVNAYENEENIKVTLLEGSVKVQSGVGSQKIKPGQQAVLNNNTINVVNEVDLEQVMAWKDGKFVFNNSNIQLIMRQMERWYDLEPTRFENAAVKQWAFNGEISRYNSASKVLQLLEKTGSVKFAMEGKKIVVKQP
ncbi:MAG TPA: FecR domain-containing protein [Niastella sp.]